MSTSSHVSLAACEQRLPSFWLPPHTRGNGLDADRWAEIVVLLEDEVASLLGELRLAGVPARAGPPASARRGRQYVQVYVAPDAYARAENVLLHVHAAPLADTLARRERASDPNSRKPQVVPAERRLQRS